MKDNLNKADSPKTERLFMFNLTSNNPTQATAYPAIPLKNYQHVSCLGWIAGRKE